VTPSSSKYLIAYETWRFLPPGYVEVKEVRGIASLGSKEEDIFQWNETNEF